MNKKTLFLFAIIVIVIFAILVVFINQDSKKPLEDNVLTEDKTNLRFAEGLCDSSIDPYSSPKDGIIKKEWSGDESRLVVVAYVITVSEGAIIRVDYKINGDNLVLEYGLDTRYAMTSSICAQKLIYEIIGLDRNDYIISLSNNNSLVQ